jgi:hypothetical protein
MLIRDSTMIEVALSASIVYFLVWWARLATRPVNLLGNDHKLVFAL